MRTLLGWELRRRWKSPGAWLFLGLNAAVIAFFVLQHNVIGHTDGLELVFRWGMRALIASSPLLMWGCCTADRRNDAWKVLRRVSSLKLAAARLLAAYSVCVVSSVLSLAAPAVLMRFSDVNLPGALSGACAILAMSFVTAALALCMESVCKKGWLAALLSCALLLGLFFMPVDALALFTHLDTLVVGIFDGRLILICFLIGLALAALSALLHDLILRRKRLVKPAAVFCVFLAVCVAAVFCVPSFTLDATRIRAMTPAPEAQGILSALDADMVASYVTEAPDPWVVGLLERYHAINPRFTYEVVGSGGADGLYGLDGETGCVILRSGDRYVPILSRNIYVYDYTYNNATQQYVATDVKFDLQSQLLSAVNFLAAEDAPAVYAYTDHFESVLGVYAQEMLYKNGFYLTGLSGDEIPEDCACLVIFAPQVDITASQRDAILAYLKDGGALILATNYQYGNFVNLFSVMEYCGMAPEGVLAVEADPNMYMDGYPYYLAPPAAPHAVTQLITGVQILMPTAHGIRTVERKGLTIVPLLTTSASSYVKPSVAATTVEREAGDLSGPVHVAVASQDSAMRAVWVSGSDYLSDSTLMLTTANLYFWVGQVAWCAGRLGTAPTVTLEAKSMLSKPLSLADDQAFILGVEIVLPALICFGIALIRAVKKRKH